MQATTKEREREVAGLRASDAVSKAHQTMTRHMQRNGGNLAMAFRRGLREAVPELTDRLVKAHVRLYWAGDDQAKDELVEKVIHHVTAFIESCARSQRGDHIGLVAREAVNATNSVKIGIRSRFKLAVDELEGPMSFFDSDEITLVKKDGSEYKTQASVQRNKIFVMDASFPVEIGDKIRHVLPSRVRHWFDVLDPGFIGGHYEIEVRNTAAPQAASAPSVVNHHYNNSGVANVVGPDGVASGNTNNVQITNQTLNIEDPRIAGELAELRKALGAEDDDDAVIDNGHVVSAQKALKARNTGGFVTAMKQLGAKGWGIAKKLALTWMTTEGRRLLGLPPG